MILVGCSLYSGTAATPPAGWTTVLSKAAGNAALVVYAHAVAAGEANSYTVNQDNTGSCVGVDEMGAAFYGPIDASAFAVSTPGGASLTTPPATGTVTGDAPFTFVAMADTNATAVASPYTGVFTAHGHPLAFAGGPLTTDTTTAQSSTYTLTGPSSGGVIAATVLLAPYNATPIAPVADTGSGYSGILPNTIAFDASASSDPSRRRSPTPGPSATARPGRASTRRTAIAPSAATPPPSPSPTRTASAAPPAPPSSSKSAPR